MLEKGIPKGSTPTENKRINQRFFIAKACLIAILALMMLTATAFGQGTNLAISGTITDTSGGVLPGATVTATNTDTGVVQRTTTNNSGIYNFANLPPGSYEVAAEAAGFTRTTRSGRFGVGSISLNIPMAVAGTVTEIAVTGTVESVILEAGSSTGTIMSEEVIQAIPLVGNNLMDILNVFAGVSEVTDPVFGAQGREFAGVRANMINVTRDGLTVTEVRQPSGVTGNTNINPEMIGEFKMVLSAVDAEMGRGAGQVMMTTRSGSNAFHGSGVWNIQNTALDAREFAEKRNNTPKSWRNLNSYILTASGPVIKNRTFFFVTWEQQFSRDKELTNVRVLTQCAKKGIYRYITNVSGHPFLASGTGLVPGARNENDTINLAGGTVPSVDRSGRPLESGKFYNVSDTSQEINLSGQLQIRSVFGEWAPGVRENLLADKGEHGVYGDCENVTFTPTLGGTSTQNFYGAGSLVAGSYWGGDFNSGGVYRHAYDSTGYIDRFTFGTTYSAGRVEMPPANYYNSGDGLNYAQHQYTNRLVGTGGSIYGSGGDPDRKSITVKIDHNINNEHRFSGTYTHEEFYVGDYHGLYPSGSWPPEYGAYTGVVIRKPRSLGLSLTSTLRPTLLNEARFGWAPSEAMQYGPQYYETTKDNMNSVLENLMPQSQTLNRLAFVGIGEGNVNFSMDSNPGSHPIGNRSGMPLVWGGPDARWTISDTITWMKGAHSFKGGFDWRLNTSRQDYNGARSFGDSGALIENILTRGGLTGNANTGATKRRNDVLGVSMAGWNDTYGFGTSQGDPSTGSGNFATPRQMMSYFAGSLQNVGQYFYLVQEGNTGNMRWNNAANGEDMYSIDLASQEASFFFKDDWKVTPNLTLNLGVRWEYYGAPYERNGYTIRLLGDAFQKAFGISTGDKFNNWMVNRNYVAAPTASIVPGVDPITGAPIQRVALNGEPPDPVSIYIAAGKGSKYPDERAWNADYNNFAPHIGFAYQLPWFGKGTTTLRGGWSVSYAAVDNFNQYGVYMGDVDAAGTSRREYYTGTGDGLGDPTSTLWYMDLSDLSSTAGGILNSDGLLNPNTDVIPLRPNAVGQFSGSGYVLDENSHNPYTHSVNMSLTRNFGRNLTVDVRYIGSMGREIIGNLFSTNINGQNYIDNGLYVELEKIRRDGNYQSPLLNSLIPRGAFSFGTTTGTDQLRTYGSATAANIASGNFSGVAGTLATSNGVFYRETTSTNGLLARVGCLPDQRTAGSTFDPVTGDWTGSCAAGTPWNYFYANPQFSGLSVYYNAPVQNYHSMQTQVTLRPTRGLNFQVTYTWSRNLLNTGWSDYTQDYKDGRDYTLGSNHRSHTLNTYGSWELPFGANGFLFRNATGAFKKAIEGWQIGWVSVMASGTPTSVTGQSTLWGRSWPELVRPDLWDDKAGKAIWSDNFIDGYYFGERYMKYQDYAICDPDNLANTNFAQDLSRYCTSTSSQALALASGQRDAAGNMLVARYNSMDEALKYDSHAKMEGSLMPAVVVFRSVDQSAGANAMGNYKAGRITGIGRFSLDMNASKRIEFMEGKSVELRVDAQNILNHPSPTGANYGITGTGAFGRFTSKSGHRTFQARLRLSF